MCFHTELHMYLPGLNYQRQTFQAYISMFLQFIVHSRQKNNRYCYSYICWPCTNVNDICIYKYILVNTKHHSLNLFLPTWFQTCINQTMALHYLPYLSLKEISVSFSLHLHKKVFLMQTCLNTCTCQWWKWIKKKKLTIISPDKHT